MVLTERDAIVSQCHNFATKYFRSRYSKQRTTDIRREDNKESRGVLTRSKSSSKKYWAILGMILVLVQTCSAAGEGKGSQSDCNSDPPANVNPNTGQCCVDYCADPDVVFDCKGNACPGFDICEISDVPLDSNGDCCSAYSADIDGCCTGYDWCSNNYAYDCNGTEADGEACEEYDACADGGDGGLVRYPDTGCTCNGSQPYGTGDNSETRCFTFDFCNDNNNFEWNWDETEECDGFDPCLFEDDGNQPLNPDLEYSYCPGFDFCNADLTSYEYPYDKVNDWTEKDIFDNVGQCCPGYNPCLDETQEEELIRGCNNAYCPDYDYCNQGDNFDYEGAVCIPYSPRRYKESGPPDIETDCDEFWNTEDDGTKGDPQWANWIYPEKHVGLGPDGYEREDLSNTCFYNGPVVNSENQFGYDDPCIHYYDENHTVCALCKYNAIRIFSYIEEKVGRETEITPYIVCGYARRDSVEEQKQGQQSEGGRRRLANEETEYDGDWTLDNEIEDYLDEISDPPLYECYADDYYYAKFGDEVNFPEYYLPEIASVPRFLPVEKYVNTTTGIEEVLCVEAAKFRDPGVCSYYLPAIDAERQSYGSELMTNIYYQTVGCRFCEPKYIHRVTRNEETGIDILTCESQEKYDTTQENVPCETAGYLQIFQGYIEQELTCVLCHQVIPNCLVCANSESCDLCATGYISAELYDSEGNLNNVCMAQFCGLRGRGITCRGVPEIPNCLKSDQSSITDSFEESEDCLICSPGYYKVWGFNAWAQKKVVRTCERMEGALEYDVFIKPSEERKMTDAEESDAYRQWKDKDAGKTINDAFYYLSQAFSRLGQGSIPAVTANFVYENFHILQETEDHSEATAVPEEGTEEWWKYQNVTINIWLAKGHHHFIQCTELGNTSPDVQARALPLLCNKTEDLLPYGKRAPLNDNIKFYIRPLECNLRFSYFKNRQNGWNDEKFWDWCVDFDAGHAKPQIRIHDTRSVFNITNFMQIENIEFTAEDAMARVNTTYDKYRGTEPIFKNVPLKKCNFTVEPTGHLEQAPVERADSMMSDILFNCSSGFNFTTGAPPYEKDKSCVPDENTESNSVSICGGEPWHQSFWEKQFVPLSYSKRTEEVETEDGELVEEESSYWLSDLQYTSRHKTLFNLYAFDTLHSERAHAPTLNLIDCDFKYFFNMTSLIQVETNNFIELGVQYDDNSFEWQERLAEGRPGLDADNSTAIPTVDEAVSFYTVESWFIGYLGEDRGARITLTNSTFKHMHFCKGMITYKEQKPISYSEYKLFVNYTASAIRNFNITDDRAEPFIRIIDSVFENIGYQQNLTDLSFQSVNTQVDDSTISSFFTYQFEKFNSRGSIINAQGFPGAIEIRDSEFKKNMVYIKEIIIEEQDPSETYYSPSTIRFSEWQNAQQYFRFKVCDSYTYEGKYVFNNLFDPNGDFDDEHFVNKYESYSPIFISMNKGPMLFIANNFTQNIGTVGGMINIQSPNFQQAMSDYQSKNASSWTFQSCYQFSNGTGCPKTNWTQYGLNETLPFIVMKNNRFEKNMAYFAGNAFYIRSTMRTKEIDDYRQFCGAGILIESNIFEGNIGMKRHNGGAGVIRCFRSDSSTDYFNSISKTSGLFLKERNATDDELDYWNVTKQVDLNYTYYEDPTETTSNVTDLFDYDSSGLYRTNYTVMKYATYITNNTFTQNYSGKKGTALLVSQVSELLLFENIFEQNGPVTAIREMEYSPYYEFMINRNRTITYFAPSSNGTVSCQNEIEYQNNCQDEDNFIDSPATQGALFIESCHDSSYCYEQVPSGIKDHYSDVEWADLLEEMSTNSSFIKPWNRIAVTRNKFLNNQASAIIDKQQAKSKQKQSTSVYIVGGIDTEFTQNEFSSHLGGFSEEIREYAPDIYDFMPDNYFEYSQAPVIQIDYLTGLETSTGPGVYNFYFDGNLFKDNRNYQIATFSDTAYMGSLFQLDCQIKLMKLKFAHNLVQYNIFIGMQSALFYINGGLIEIMNNNFSYNGMTSNRYEQNHPDSLIGQRASTSHFPYQQYTFQLSQDAGVFTFDFSQHDIPSGNAHIIHNNSFKHIYCKQGCAYSAKGTNVQQFWFQQNTYTTMLASGGGSVFDSFYSSLRDNNQFRDVWLQVYINETITETFGGAISVKSTNVPITIIENTVFEGNLGTKGASISFDQGGGLYCLLCQFSDQNNRAAIPEKYQQLLQAQEQMNEVVVFIESDTDALSSTEQNNLASEGPDEFKGNAVPLNLNRRLQTETHTQDEDIGADGTDFADQLNKARINLGMYIKQNYQGEVPFNTFIDDESLEALTAGLMGNTEGQVYISGSQTNIKNSETIIVAHNMTLQQFIEDEFELDVLNTKHSAFFDPIFSNCTGKVSSALSIYGSYVDLLGRDLRTFNFIDNVASEGTTVFAQASTMKIKNIVMISNLGNEGGCLHSVSTSVTIDESYFARNAAEQGGVFFAIQKSTFVVHRSYMVQNVASDASVMYGLSNFAIDSLHFTDCVFSENYGQSNTMHMLNSILEVHDSTFTNNYSLYVTHGITLIASQLVMANSTIEFSENCYYAYNLLSMSFQRVCDENTHFLDRLDLSKLDTGFFNLYLTSKAFITDNTNVMNLKAQKQAVASVIGQSTMVISKNVTFYNNVALSQTGGSTLQFRSAGDILISEAHFVKNPQVNLACALTNMTIMNSTFTEGSASFVWGDEATIKLIGVHMYNSSDIQSVGHGFYCTLCFNVLVIESTFENLRAREGGAIYLGNMVDQTSEISNCLFDRNQATEQAGAIKLENPARLLLHANKFTENAVVKETQTYRFADAGAIWYSCQPSYDQHTECNVVLTNNTFVYNTAPNKGGAARWVNKNFTFDASALYQDDSGEETLAEVLQRRMLQQVDQAQEYEDSNTYIGNFANYGPNLGSYPKTLRYTMTGAAGSIDQPPTNEVNGELAQMAPGQLMNLKIEILDQEGRLYVDEQDAIATIDFVADQLSLAAASVIAGREAIASDGVFTFPSLAIRQTPETQSQIQLEVTGILIFENEVGFMKDFPKFEVQARQCIEGERYGDDLACIKCPIGYYHYLAQLEPGACIICNLAAHCYGQNFTAPRPGYWRSSPNNENYIECHKKESCLGGDLEYPLGRCLVGHSGILCADCIDEYFRTGRFNCEECPGFFTNTFASIFVAILLIAIIVIVIRAHIQGSAVKRPLYAVYLKIFLNHFQLISVISQIDFGWPAQIQAILALQSYFADIPKLVLSTDCLLMQLFLGGNPQIRLFYLRIVSFALFPFVVMISSWVFWLIYGLVKGIEPQERKDKAVATISIILFLFYPTIVTYLAESVSCYPVEGVMRLYGDLEEQCYTGNHMLIIIFVSIPGLLFWALGIPLFFNRKLNQFKEDLKDAQLHSSAKVFDVLQQRFRLRLGFLTSGYLEDYYYWEIVLLLRKTFLVLMMTFLAPVSGGVQSLSSILTLIGFLIMHSKIDPYYDAKLNNLEKISLFVLIFTLYSGLFYQAGRGDDLMETDYVKWVIFFMVFIPSCIFMLYFLGKLRIEVLRKCLQREFFFKVISCGLIDRQIFQLEHEADDEESDDIMFKPNEALEKRHSLYQAESNRKNQRATVHILRQDLQELQTSTFQSKIKNNKNNVRFKDAHVDHKDIQLHVKSQEFEYEESSSSSQRASVSSEVKYHNNIMANLPDEVYYPERQVEQNPTVDSAELDADLGLTTEGIKFVPDVLLNNFTTTFLSHSKNKTPQQQQSPNSNLSLYQSEVQLSSGRIEMVASQLNQEEVPDPTKMSSRSAKSIKIQGSIAPSGIESATEVDGVTTIVDMQFNTNKRRDNYLADEVIDEHSDDMLETEMDVATKPKQKRRRKGKNKKLQQPLIEAQKEEDDSVNDRIPRIKISSAHIPSLNLDNLESISQRVVQRQKDTDSDSNQLYIQKRQTRLQEGNLKEDSGGHINYNYQIKYAGRKSQIATKLVSTKEDASFQLAKMSQMQLKKQQENTSPPESMQTKSVHKDYPVSKHSVTEDMDFTPPKKHGITQAILGEDEDDVLAMPKKMKPAPKQQAATLEEISQIQSSIPNDSEESHPHDQSDDNIRDNLAARRAAFQQKKLLREKGPEMGTSMMQKISEDSSVGNGLAQKPNNHNLFHQILGDDSVRADSFTNSVLLNRSISHHDMSQRLDSDKTPRQRKKGKPQKKLQSAASQEDQF